MFEAIKLSISQNLKRGTAELLLLALILEGETYGYELSQELLTRSRGQFVLQEGSLYPTLYRLEKKGYITSRQVTLKKSKRFRVYYQITAEGKQYYLNIKREYIAINQGIFSVLGLKGLDKYE